MKQKLILLTLIFTGLVIECPVVFAVPDGYVVKIDSASAYLDWGASSGVHVGDQFKVYRNGEELKHPVTGEVLGHVETSVTTGHIDQVEQKFSIATLDRSGAKTGDRTRATNTATAPIVSVGMADSTSTVSGQVPALQEVWRSDLLPGAVTGIACADLLGDGRSELVVSYKTKIELFRLRDGKLTSLATYQHRLYRHWLGVEAADLSPQGHDDLFANAWFDGANRPHVVVLRWDGTKLKPVADLDGFVRAVEGESHRKKLVWQTISRNREKHFSPPSELIEDHGVYKPGPSLKISSLRDDQLEGFVLGDWDGSHHQHLAVLENGDRLKVTLSTGDWTAPETQGGTKNEFVTEINTALPYTPRLLARTLSSGSDELISPHNIPELAIRLFQIRFFKDSELTGWAWKDQNMAIEWRQPFSGYLADYAIGNVLSQPSPQLWVATTTSDDKTQFLAYRLP